MKRGIIAIVAVLLISGGYVVSIQPWKGAVAQEGRIIPINVMSHRDNADGSLANGEECGWNLGTLNVLWADPQLIVRDQGDNIVAMETLEGGTIRRGDIPSSAFCELALNITVPDAEYYTLYLASLEEIRIMGFRADDFPIDDFAPISIDPDLD